MTITLTREEAQQVLDAIVLSMPMFVGHSKQHAAAIETLRARLAQPEPEPVACPKEPANIEELYTAPPQREWQELSDYDVDNIVKASSGRESAVYLAEAKLKEKNT